MESKSSKIAVKIAHGVFGFVILDKLPKELSVLVKPLGVFHDGSESDLMLAAENGFPYLEQKDVRGWHYDRSVVEVLVGANVEVTYLGAPVYNAEGITAIDKENELAAVEKLKPKD